MGKIKTIVGVLFFLIALFYIACIHYQDSHHIAILWNRINGEARLEASGGIKFTLPWVAAAKIDTRPMRVCVTSSSKSFNCKLVQFAPEAYKEFLRVEGFRYYWLSNRISINFGYDEEYRGMKDILRGYAYDVRMYPFIRIVSEYDKP